MATWVWIVIGIAAALVLIAVIAGATMFGRKRQTGRLQDRFGPEYDRTVDGSRSRRKGEAQLVERERRHDELEIRPLTEAARERYAEQWRLAQTQFVDTPEEAVRNADSLVTVVMRERGYPVDDFDRRADDISVDHPHLVDDYRQAQRIARASQQGTATTEELRQAMVHYRSLFDELLGDRADAAAAPLSRDDTAGEPTTVETPTPARER